MNKKLLVVLPALLATGSLVACGGGGGGGGEDPTKTYISIATYEGGLGRQWIDDICATAEKVFANYQDSTTGDKVGVKFKVSMSKAYEGTKVESSMGTTDIFFTEQVNYGKMAQNGKLLDLTEAVTSNLSEFGDTGTIEDKLDQNFKSYLKFHNNKYYALPFYDGIYGLYYDVDYFDTNKWFRTENNQPCKSTSSNLHSGIDGIKGTFDDGLPRTIDEFKALCSKMAEVCYPVGFSSASIGYINRYASGLWANNVGYEQANLSYTFNGTATGLVEVDQQTGQLVPYKGGSVNITYENGYEVAHQKGKYDALKFINEAILGTGNYTPIATSTDFKVMQSYFVNTLREHKTKTSPTNSKIAMLVDGSWWENEAEAPLIVDEAEYPTDGGRMKRKFSLMPFPRADLDSCGTKNTLTSMNASFAFANASTQHPDLVRKIMKYFHTSENLSRFTSIVGMTRPFNYTVSESDLAKTSYFGKQMVKIKSECDVSYPYSNLQVVMDNDSFFSQFNYPWSYAEITKDMFSTFKGENDYNTPEKYFTQSANYYEKNWKKAN